MMMLRHILKKAFKTLGYEIVKIQDAVDAPHPPRSPADSVSDREMEKLCKDLDAFFVQVNGPHSTDQSWNGYDTQEMLGYLTRERLSFYHELLVICHDRALHFDGKTIADVGTYLGYLPRLILDSQSTCRVFGLDNDERSLGLARHLCPSCEFAVFDLLRNPGHYTGRFDIVFCTEVLEHATDPDRLLAALMVLLAPSGVLVLTVPNGRTDQIYAGEKRDDESYTGHINFWSPESWDIFLRKNVTVRVETGLMPSGENFAVIRNSEQTVISDDVLANRTCDLRQSLGSERIAGR